MTNFSRRYCVIKIFRKIGLLIVATIVSALIIVTFIDYHNGLIAEFSNTGVSAQADLNGRITTSTCFVELMTTLGNEYFSAGGTTMDSKDFGLLNYNAEANEYNMDGIKGATYATEKGNLTGVGAIPQSGVDKEEINLALSFNNYFSHFYNRLPEIAWMYYTSENGFINMYPWISSTDFKYSEELKDVAFYSVATPENDPTRAAVWTPVYVDAAGKGLMITLSSPIYNEDEFKGVISLDFTTNVLGGILQSEYESYLVDSEYNVIASSRQNGANGTVPNLKDGAEFTDADIQAVMSSKYDVIAKAGTYYIFKARLADAPWTVLIVAPISSIIGKTLVLTLPEIIIGVLLLFAYFVLMNLRKAERLIRNASLTDPLTGLNNRRFLDAMIEKEMARADRYKESLSIANLDLDRFKKVNDTWGHPIGDEVLKQTATIVKNSIRESDVLIRLGGEEFAILLPQTDIDAAYMVAERARKAIEEASHPIAGKVTASFGVAERQNGESYNNLYRRVDEALYSAKNKGRNCVVVYEEKNDKLAFTVKIEWNPAWECGEAGIDMQHRRLLELGNKLFGMVKADPKDFIYHLQILINHIVEHFEYEESVQKAIGYPESENHAKLHLELTEKALQIKEAFMAGKMKSSAMISFIMDDVIIGHLLEEDTKFFPYYKERSE